MDVSKIQNPKSKISSVLRGKRIGIIGAGNMGHALIKGLRAGGVPSTRLLVIETNRALLRRVRTRYHVVDTTLKQAAHRCDVMIVAVKPQDIQPVLSGLRGYCDERRIARPLIISIAAGVTTASIERTLGRTPVVRVMPNLPAKIGRAISAVAAGRLAASSHRALAGAIFRCVGEVVELPERLFDAVTAVSGSGPAYFFLVVQALRDAAIREGVPKTIAEQLALHTALGSVQLAHVSQDDVDTLIRQVASKGGTTEAALAVLHRQGLPRTIHAGVHAAARRSRELSREISLREIS